MQLGRFKVEQLSEGTFEFYKNGDFRKIEHPDEAGEAGGARGLQQVGIDPVLIQDDSFTLLMDAGLGIGLDNESKYRDTSNLKTNLAIFGVDPRDVDIIILSHLHYDHTAGLTYTDAGQSVCAVFPNAVCIAQKQEWEHALQKQFEAQQGVGYELDDLYRLKADNQIKLVDEEKLELLPGITLIRTGGHTPGHQIVRISDWGQTAYYLGDLLPDERFLNYNPAERNDENPGQTKWQQKQVLGKAAAEEAILLFYHSLRLKAGKIDRINDQEFTLTAFRNQSDSF